MFQSNVFYLPEDNWLGYLEEKNGTTRSLQTLDGIHFLSWQSENEGVRSKYT